MLTLLISDSKIIWELVRIEKVEKKHYNSREIG